MLQVKSYLRVVVKGHIVLKVKVSDLGAGKSKPTTSILGFKFHLDAIHSMLSDVRAQFFYLTVKEHLKSNYLQLYWQRHVVLSHLPRGLNLVDLNNLFKECKAEGKGLFVLGYCHVTFITVYFRARNQPLFSGLAKRLDKHRLGRVY
jgi:hypothetical protein